MFREHKRLTSLAVVLIIFSIGFLVWSGSIIIKANTPESSTTEIKLGEPTFVNIVGGGEQDFTKYVEVNFETLEVFAGDTISITASAPLASRNLVNITMIIADPDFYFGDDNDHLFHSIANMPPEYIIGLFPNTDPPFKTTKEVKFVKPNQEVMIYAVSFGINSIAKYKSDVAFTVHSQTDKLQVKTNTAILDQITEQEKTNAIFIGLSLIGIAVIPMLIGADIFLRIYFNG